MSRPPVLSRRPPARLHRFVRTRVGLNLVLDDRAQNALRAITRETGETGTDLLVRLLDGRARSCPIARSVLVVEHLRLFGQLPPGAFLGKHEGAWRKERDLKSARREGRRAGRKAARKGGYCAGN